MEFAFSISTTLSFRDPTLVKPARTYLLFETIAKIFPVLHHLKTSPDEKFELVNDTIIEEVLQDIGSIDFGSGLSAKTNVGIWRTRGEHRPLIGEFAFQIRFGDRKVLTLDAMQRAERFFIALQLRRGITSA